MNEIPDGTPKFTSARPQARLGLMIFMGFHIVTCCASLIYVADFYDAYQVVMFDKTRLYAAAANIAPFAIVSAVFAFSRFSFGYFLGFYFYTVVLGYLWLVEFSKFHYDHTLTSISALASAVAFLVPAMFITSPIRQRLILSPRTFDHLLSCILVFAAAAVAAGAFYNFRLVGLDAMYSFRGELEFPGWLRYAMAATANALLPFAFACFVARNNRWRAAVVLLLLLLLYPITLTKLTLFAPLWLLFLALLSRFFEARYSVVLSLFVPILGGVILATLVNAGAFPYPPFMSYFSAVNFRMIAFPSVAIDIYNDFFSTHDHTYFCQIYLLKPLVNCPYSEPLSVVMAKAYQLGNLNASLFATEGIASVGLVLAPLAVLACGLVISLGNRLSSGLPPKFILLSGGVLTQNFLNVPLTTNLLTGGAAVVFLLWYVTPRAMFEGIADKRMGN
jgi:hypothetical protein